MHATLPRLLASKFPKLVRDSLQTLQVNLGYRCNQQCLHCHVDAGPKRKEVMTRDTVDDVLKFLERSNVARLDLTGGAPELNPSFRYLVEQTHKMGLEIVDRCNLTVLFEPNQKDLAEFLARHSVKLIASLPCYLQQNVDDQRGKGVFSESIQAVKLLNQIGYAKGHLILDLVYNPLGPYLPPSQHQLELDYKRELQQHDIYFNDLLVITNMPINRFGSTLISNSQFDTYLNLLKSAFQVNNLEAVMCRNLLSVDWQGIVYDCDFNQMLDLPANLSSKPRTYLRNITSSELVNKPIAVADHCYGCTAGQGSSCGGALV